MFFGCKKEGKCIYDFSKKKIKIVGISSSKRSKFECAREDPISLELLKISLDEAKRAGAEVQLIDLRDLQIGACKECYSTCPAQCRFNEKNFQCDCYMFKQDSIFVEDNLVYPIEEAYDRLNKEKFFELYHSHGNFAEKDEMYKVYQALMEADGIIFATFTNYYSRPALLQAMISRFCALDGGVEDLWGDGKNLGNSIKYAKNKNAKYKQRLYGKWAGFINTSKEGDSVTPDLMKACTMLGMKTIPLGVSYNPVWYSDQTHRSDKKKVLSDKYSIEQAKHLGKTMVEEIKNSHRHYGKWSYTV